MKKIIPNPNTGGKASTPARAEAVKVKSGPRLTFILDGQERKIAPAQLCNQSFADKLRDQCGQAEKPVVVDLTNLLKFDDKNRFATLDFIAGLDRATMVVNGKSVKTLFNAVLAHTPKLTNLDHVRNFKMAALEVAVLTYPDALELACTKIAKRMQKLKIRGLQTAALLLDAKRIRAELSKTTSRPDEKPQTVREVLPDAPVGADATVPPGWVLAPEGVRNLRDRGPQIAAPLLIRGRCHDVNRGEEMLTISWKRDGVWSSRVVERSILADTRSVTRLAAYGAPVTSNTAKQVVQFLADYEKVNLDRLPATRVSHQLGWQGSEGKYGFLLGNQVVTTKGVVQAGGESDDREAPTPEIQFLGADEGDEQTARGYHQKGDLDGWLTAITPIASFPRVKLAFYASLTAVMLMILRARNIILDFAGENTSGKTITLRVAGSIWGNPDENSPQVGTVVYTWDATSVWRERAPATLNNLPFILDDTKRARRREDVEQTVYDFSQGRARGRGSVKGLASQTNFQTVLLTSGEQPATSFTEAGGTRARVLTCWGSPFGAKDSHTGTLARALDRRIKRNYGHAGPLFVQFLLQNRSKWKEWRTTYRELVKEYVTKAGDNPLAGRLAEDFAAIRLTARLVHQAIQLPWLNTDPIAPLWDELVGEAGEADRAAAALRHVMGWAAAHQSEFFQPFVSNERDRQPLAGWAGIWPSENVPNVVSLNKKKPRGRRMIGFIPNRLTEILRESGFEPEPVIRTWKDRGWLVCGDEQSGAMRSRIKVKIAGRCVWVVAIKQSAVTAAEGR